MALVISLIVIASAFWIYHDAVSNKIGLIKDGEKKFNMSAGAWAIYTLLFWLIGFPLYLAKRNYLLERAKAHPVEVSSTTRMIVYIAIIVGGSISMTIFYVALQAFVGRNIVGSM